MNETRYTRSASFGTTGLWACTECGAGVLDRYVHDRFHDRLVLAEPDDGLDETDIRVDVFTRGVDSPVQMRLTHLPTGVAVSNEGRGHKRVRDEARAMLAAAVARHRALGLVGGSHP